MEVTRIFKIKPLAICIGFWIVGVISGRASSFPSYCNLRCGSLGKIKRSGTVSNARNCLRERRKSLRAKRNRYLARVRKGHSKISKKVKNFSNGAGFGRENP